jgi:hypothetical protein
MSLDKKHVLIVSSFSKEVRTQFSKISKLHRKSILSDCKITSIQAPQTNGLKISLRPWKSQLEIFEKKLIDQIQHDHPDVVLVAAGSYGMPISNFLYKNGCNVIYVGGALQLFFGIWGSRWRNSKEVLDIATESWIWPSRKSKPFGSFLVEHSSYW